MERLHLFDNDAAVDVYNKFFDYKQSVSDGTAVERGVARLARLDEVIATVLTCLKKRERQGGRRQKLYADTYTSYVNMAIQ